MNSSRIRVMVVDDHAMVRSGLRLFLLAFDDFELVGEAANGLEAVRLCELAKPDVILMDLIMPGMDGIQATREIKSHCQETQIIAITSFIEPDLIVDALDAGVISFLLKTVSATELADAIRAARAGHPTLAPEAQDVLRKAAQARRASQAAPVELTEREQQVLELMASGKNNLEISRQLVISLSTVKFHVSSILRKLSASSRAEAISLAIQQKLVDPLKIPTHSDKGASVGPK